MVITCKDIKGFENEAGGHRWQEISGTGKKARVHTSTVTVSVLLDEHTEKSNIARNDRDFSIVFFSGTGAGGQHRNRHQNSVRMTHIPTGITQTAVSRERAANIASARTEIERKLDEMEKGSFHKSTNNIRKNQIGSGQRGDKMRTYRFQDNQIYDNNSGKSMRCKDFMKGNIDELWKK